jgi:outer membrane protein assembly factor BamB
LVFYKNGSVFSVDYKTGRTAWWADVVNASRVLTCAIEYNVAAGELYIITQARQGTLARAVLTVFISNRQSKEVPLADLKYHVPVCIVIFDHFIHDAAYGSRLTHWLIVCLMITGIRNAI